MHSKNLDSQSSYIIDEPVKAKDDDQLDRYPIAQRIVKTIVVRNDPSSLVIGLYGEWGEGKSSVLNFVDSIFSNEHKDSVCCIRFNPWYFRNEDQLLTTFFEILASKLDERIKFNRERIGGFSKDYLAKLVPPTTTKFVGIDIGEMFNRWGGLISGISLDERKKRIEEILEEKKKKIVIMIDDIDRLDNNEIQTVLKLVKLLANFKHTTYILAFDVEMVATAIGKNYGEDKVAGKNFLEKIIQVPILLPKISREALESFCFRAIRQELESLDINLNDDEWRRFTENFETGLSIRVQTIRMVKRYINALIFALPQIKNEVNIVDFLLLEGMRIFYPKHYSDLKDKPSEYLNLSSSSLQIDSHYRKTTLDNLIQKWHELANGEVSAKRLLFCLFPEICTMFISGENSDWIAIREISREQKLGVKQRVCTEEYFRRFFEYKVPNDDISDIEIDTLFKQIGMSNPNSFQTITNLVNEGKADALILKITNRLDHLSPELAQNLAIIFSKFGNDFLSSKRQKSIRLFVQPLPWQFQDLVYKLVEKLPEVGQRFSLVKKILDDVDLFPFGINFFEYIVTDEQKWISSDQEKILGQTIAEKIICYFEERSIFESDKPLGSLITILIQFGVKEENYKLFEREISKDPNKAFKLVSCFFTRKTFNYDFNNLDSLVDIKTIHDAIQNNTDLEMLDVNDISLEEGQLSSSIPKRQKHSYQAFLEWYQQKESQ
ncbi:MAG TPA: hypothetical protein DCZ88_08550 [Pseudanabaena sp.]|nr:hypothetical protein [Pseudanabaena sp.]